jgi:hypothetical protein
MIVHVPEALNVTTPPDSVHVPDAESAGVSPVVDPVTAEMEDRTGVYVCPDTGDVGTADVNESV